MRRIVTRESTVIFVGTANKVVEYWTTDGLFGQVEHIATKPLPAAWEPA